jgi:hypothetical protein
LITVRAQGSRYRGLVEQWQRRQHMRTPTVNG